MQPSADTRRASVRVLLAACAVAASSAEEALAKFQQWQAQEMLRAASKGRLSAVQALLDRGCPPDACDYDRRTGLMLAASGGHEGVVSLLLAAGANPNARDNLGGSPLLEAVKGDQPRVVAQLVAAGGTLQLSGSELASALCLLAAADQQQLLRLYIAAGANVSAAEYNQQTALHVAAARGNLSVVSAGRRCCWGVVCCICLSVPHACLCACCWMPAHASHARGR